MTVRAPCLVLLVILASGCALQPREPAYRPANWQQRADHQGKINNWELLGKMAVRYPDGNDSARIKWLQNGTSFTIRFSGPAGIGSAHIHGDDHEVTFEKGDDRKSAGNATELSEILLGWPLPVENLKFWVRGIPAPHSRVNAWDFDTQGRLASLYQDGWKLTFESYFTSADGTEIPERIEARHRDFLLTLLIKEWRSGTP